MLVSFLAQEHRAETQEERSSFPLLLLRTLLNNDDLKQITTLLHVVESKRCTKQRALASLILAFHLRFTFLDRGESRCFNTFQVLEYYNLAISTTACLITLFPTNGMLFHQGQIDQCKYLILLYSRNQKFCPAQGLPSL